MTDARIAELLEELAPNYDDRDGDWERVAASARTVSTRPIQFSTRVRLGVLVTAIAAATALVLAWPFNDQHGNILDRALAAVGDGPVLHVVLRGEWGGTLVELSSGERSPVYGEDEVWYDTEHRRAHSIERLGGVLQDEELYKPNKPAAEFAALGREYRQALASRTARITGEDTIAGDRVVWVTIHSELLPEPGGKDHVWAQQVAVSKRTFEPVALRETRDGQPGPGTLQRVLELELLAKGDFTPSRPTREGTAFRQGRERISLEEARTVLGRTPLWLGRDYEGLPLAQVYRETTSIGHERRVRLTGPTASAAIKCSEQSGAGAGNCFRALGVGSIEVRPNGVFTTAGPIRWREEQTSVVLFYGSIGDDPSTYLEDAAPMSDKPYITVTEGTEVSPLRRGAGSYVPPRGSVFIAADGTTGFLERDGLQISIKAGSEAAALAAARALMPMTG